MDSALIIPGQMLVDSIAFAVPTLINKTIPVCYGNVTKKEAIGTEDFEGEMHRHRRQMPKK
jgi:hypothetical protein